MAPKSGPEGEAPAGGGGGEAAEPKLSPDTTGVLGELGNDIAHPVTGFFGKKSWKAVFDKSVATVTGKNAYETEKAEAALKKLSSSDIASAQAMSLKKPGTVQNHTAGDIVDQIDGDHFIDVKQNDYLTVHGFQTHMVYGPADLRFKDNRTLTVRGNYQLSIFQRSDTFVLGESTEQYVAQHEVTAPDEFEWKQFERGFSALKQDISLLGLDLHVSDVDVNVMNVELAVFEGLSKVFHEKTEMQEMHAILLIIKVALELDILIRGDVLIDLGTGTPFR